MKRRIITALLTLAILFMLLPFGILSASAATVGYPVVGGNLYFDTETYAITDCDSTVTEAVIPEYIDGLPVTKIAPRAFSDCKQLKKVEIYGSVLEIQNWAFAYCEALETIILHDEVWSIGQGAFEYTAIKEIYLSEFLYYVHDGAFSNCDQLEYISVSPDNSYYASVGGILFNKNLEFLLRVPPKAGMVEFPDCTLGYSEEAFEGCNEMALVIIGENMNAPIDGHTFYDCKNLVEIRVSEKNKTYTAVNGLLYTKAMDKLIYCPRSRGIVISIPQGVKTICDNAFWWNLSLQEVYIAPGLTEIGDLAFWECNTLKGIYFAGDAPRVGDHTFEHYINEEVENHYAPLENLTIYYNEEGEGWTSPTWNGIPAVAEHYCTYYGVDTPPSCTEQGYTTYTCACGDSFTDHYIPALGHDYWEGICNRCGAEDPNYVAPVLFADVPENIWYYPAVQYAVSNKLMNGIGNQKFDPEGAMTRAMLVTVLWRYAGEPEQGSNSFTDVPNGLWYTNAVAWAAHNGIVSGIGNNHFDPDGKITREQMATILFRYSNSLGMNTSNRASLSSFPDGGKVSGYAKDALSWAVAEGLITGSASGGKIYLEPQGNATRAQVATILMRYIENVVKNAESQPVVPEQQVTYEQTIRELLEKNRIVGYGEGFLYDLNADGTQELITMYTIDFAPGIAELVCSVYTISGNGVKNLLYEKELYAMAGGPSAYGMVVEKDGKHYLAITRESGETGEDALREGDWWRYAFDGTSLTLESQVEYEYRMKDGEVVPAESSAIINGIKVDYEEYVNWVSDMNCLVYMDGYCGSFSSEDGGLSLEELLEQCR